MIRLAIAGPDGAGKSVLCQMLHNRIFDSKLQYAGKNRGHVLKSTSIGLKLWTAMAQFGNIPALIGQYFIFYPFEYAENLVRFRMVPDLETQLMIYDRHPIDRMVLKYDTVLRLQEGKIKSTRFIVEHPLRLFWGCIYRYFFSKIDRVYVLLPAAELCFERSGGQYKSIEEAIIRVETYRRAVFDNNNKFTSIVIHRHHMVEDICQLVLEDIKVHGLKI